MSYYGIWPYLPEKDRPRQWPQHLRRGRPRGHPVMKEWPFEPVNDNVKPPPAYQYDYQHHYPPRFGFGQIIGLIACGAIIFIGLMVLIVEVHEMT